MSDTRITPENAQQLVQKAFPDVPHSHVDITEIPTKGSFCYSQTIRTYILSLSTSPDSPSSHITFLTICTSEDSNSPYPPNTLPVFAHLISLIRSQTPVPLSPPVLDTSLTVLPHPYLLSPPEEIQLSSIITLSSARQQKLLSPEQEAVVDFGLGQLLAQLHSQVQNDWFGRALGPDTTPAEPSYSWQETFTSLLESLLSHLQSPSFSQAIQSQIPFNELRLYLGRAIAFYLFDDVEVPSLVWFTGSEDDIYIFKPTASTNPSDLPTIAAFLPSLTHAIWGDPLLETFFLPSKGKGGELPSAVMEGYREGGGEILQAFPRQKTKRLWYNVFLALLVLIERSAFDEEDERRGWALETLKDSALQLKDAPCY
ncbi:hypothetical protein D9758_005664 [Tetrapyrgos nigripes]|uniref:Uncharacterized protein n=1 Tax=Tetrapyrgos nigripes TaxID=182062 RepID=A0A8H5LR23_9AGAR|nr:hypothetical protein D9758_005664 [Tetrapyrgos nigripes]